MNLRAESIPAFLKIRPSLLKLFTPKELEQIGMEELWTWQAWKDLDNSITPETIRMLIRDKLDVERFRIAANGRQAKLTTQIFPYLTKQAEQNDSTFRDIAVIWTEYIWLAQKKDLDLTKKKNLYPEDIIDAFNNVFTDWYE